MKTPWFSIVNRSPLQPLEILIYDEIGGAGVSAAELVNQINAASSQPIRLRINSPGGSVFEGYAIYNALLRHKAGVEVEIEGVAASIASYIAMAGKPVRMAENALMMIHNPNVIASGDADDMRRSAEMLDKVRAGIIEAYVKKIGASGAKDAPNRDQLSAMMDAETWFSAADALAVGLIDEISAPLKAAASFDLARFRNVPANLRPAKALSAAVAVAVASATGCAITEDSTPDDVRAALTKLTTARPELADAENKILDLTAALARSTKQCDLLESYCCFRGIDAKNAPPHMAESAPMLSQEDATLRLATARTPEDRGRIVAEVTSAAANGRLGK